MTGFDAAADTARFCPRCRKRLARLNPGPTCFACEPLARDPAHARTEPRHRRLPYDEVMSLYGEVGNVTEVARRLGLPRSSVWYVVHRAKRDERIACDDDGAPNVRE
jgi:hypothetical protein